MRAPVVVVGPTASGKSDVAIAAAREAGGTEIIAVDAMQVYRGMDIGTAKPTPADRAAVPHHGIDLVDPREPFTVADFRAAYDVAIGAIAERGARALLVAGTGLYLTAVIDRLDLPGPFPAVRAQLERDVDTPSLYARLLQADTDAAARIEPGNRRRIVRALEVTLGSGRPFSSFGPGIDAFPPTAATLIGLRWPRPALAQRIERRVHRMLEDGLLAEVERLANRPGEQGGQGGHGGRGGLSRTAAQALGYKELLDHLAGAVSLDEAVSTIVVRTRQFAVRQERWFRRDPRIRWFDIEREPVAEVGPAVLDALRT